MNCVSNIWTKCLWWLYDWSLETSHLRRLRIPDLVVPAIAVWLRIRYWHVLIRLRRKVKNRKLKVAFLLGDVTKWKGQTVYDAMLRSKQFDPYVAPIIVDAGFYAERELLPRLRACKAYFQTKGLRILDVCDGDTGVPQPLSKFNVDIAIYLQPWGIARCQHPITVSNDILTFYLPYSIEVLGGERFELFDMPFIRWVYGQFMHNESWAEFLKRTSSRFRPGSIIYPVGSPHCELLFQPGCQVERSDQYTVIYAPHWSFHHVKNLSMYYLSTFAEFGEKILGFAKAHPEIHWIFKPHPGLRSKLGTTGYMTKKEINNYYKAWEQLGEACYTGDYFPLFLRSDAMITDCVTFLTEYLLTGKPLIRLVATNPEYKPLPPSKRLMEAFYEVRTEADMDKMFQRILIEHRDELKQVRQDVVRDIGYDKLNATEKLMDVLKKLFRLD